MGKNSWACQSQLINALWFDPESQSPEFVSGQGLRDAQERLEIYRYAVWERMIRSLEDDFEETATWLKAHDQDFDDLARDYLVAYPSQYASLAELGRNLTGYVRTSNPWKQWPELLECASKDWVSYWAGLVDREKENVDWGSCSEDSILVLNPTLTYDHGWLGWRNLHGVQCEKITPQQWQGIELLQKKPQLEVLSQILGAEWGEERLAEFMSTAVAKEWIDSWRSA